MPRDSADALAVSPNSPPMTLTLASLRDRCDASLDELLPPATSNTLSEAMRYAVLGGGKRLRPLLVYAAGQAAGVATERLDPAAMAIELIHAYSLVHDDLPAMDDDDLRRGRPTVHKAYDEATAILTGDALQALAFETLTRGVEAGLPAETVLAQSRELAHGAGASGMAGGQALDLSLVGAQPDAATLARMHQMKTGALIGAAVRMGALAAGNGNGDRFDEYARALGLAFQIQDDVLDEVGDSTVTGKTTGADRRRGKPTFVSALGLDAARTRAIELHAAAVASLSTLDGDTSLLHELADRLVKRDA